MAVCTKHLNAGHHQLQFISDGATLKAHFDLPEEVAQNVVQSSYESCLCGAREEFYRKS